MYPVQLARHGSGFSTNHIIAGEDLPAKKLVYIDGNGEWKLCDSDALANMPVTGITIDIIGEGLKGDVLVGWGFIGDASWSFTPGGLVYAGATPGELTQDIPDAGTAIPQAVGKAALENLIEFSPNGMRGHTQLVELYTESIPADELGKPGVGTPTEDDFDNLTIYAFTVDTDFMTYQLSIPTRYASGGIKMKAVWTNDGGLDNNGERILAEFSYQTAAEGDQISGNHTNSPKTVDDTYDSDLGRVEHHTEYMTIAEADFEGKQCIYIKISFIKAPDVELNCEPRLIGVCLQYTRYVA